MEVNLPPPVSAYGVRKLFKAFSGNAIRVRRSNDNAELDIPFDEKGNLDMSLLNSFLGNNQGFVVVWYDQSGNNRNKIEEIAANQKRIS